MLTRSQRLLPANQLLEFQKKLMKGEILFHEVFILAIQDLGHDNEAFMDAVAEDFETSLQSYRSIDANNAFVSFYEMYQSRNVDLNFLCKKTASGSHIFKELKKYLEKKIRDMESITMEDFFSRRYKEFDMYEELFNTVDRYFEDSTFRELLATNYKMIIGLEEEYDRKYRIVRFSKHGKETIYDSGITIKYCL